MRKTGSASVTGLSLEEYRWIRNQSYRALGQPFVDRDVSKILENAKRGVQSGIGELRGSLGPDGPAANREGIARFEKLLQENLALASFGRKPARSRAVGLPAYPIRSEEDPLRHQPCCATSTIWSLPMTRSLACSWE